MLVPLDVPAGLQSDDTTFGAAPAWSDASNVRFRLGRPQTVGGWESVTSNTLTGVCRAVLSWTDNSNTPQLAFGTHSALQVWVNDATIYTVTPYGPVSVLGTDPLATTNLSTTVTVTHTAHGLATNDVVIISGATTTNGIDAANINGSRTITVTSANAYTFTAGAADAASSTGSGGGSAVRIVPQVVLPSGAINGAGSAGYGTGTYGGGGYGTASSDAYYPRTWSLAAWGQKLLASPRGGALYIWENVTATRAIAVANCPPVINAMLVTPQFQVMALGCTQENGVYGPKTIRHCAVRDETTWTTLASSASTAREYALPGGGFLVGGKVCGKNLLVWSNHELWLGTYVGQINQVWRFDKVGDKCGLIGPNAAAVFGSMAVWLSPDLKFYSYALGGSVQPVTCPIQEDFEENVAAAQGAKVVASTNAKFDEVRFDYPDARDGVENSRYVAVCINGPDAGSWTRGEMARTAMVDAGPSLYPCGVTYGGNIYWHEKGSSADGGALDWFIETADTYLDENRTSLIRKIFPDINTDQQGAVMMTIYTRNFQQGEVTTNGPYTIAAGQDEVDVIATGRLARFRFYGSSAPAYARLGRPLIDVKPRGKR